MGAHGNPATNPSLHDVSAYHSHVKSYARTGTILGLLTVVEIAGLFFPEWIPGFSPDLLPPIMVVLAAVKFAMVVGLFMHLADDAHVYKVVFIAPLMLAIATIMVLGMMVMQHWDVYGKTYSRLFTNKSKLERMEPDKYFASSSVKPKLTPEAYDKLFAETSDHSEGKKIFGMRCAACHRKDGGGMPNLGPNMTDDCYKNGSRIYDFVNVLSNGVKGTAMVALIGPQLTDEEGTAVALYVRSLRGTNVAGGLDCAGDKADGDTAQ
jgi:mono/diheme cytochrome c family protein/heme/copper-type cytochrome/quinol oxidase subunit 4